jgi:hypothetical protein
MSLELTDDGVLGVDIHDGTLDDLEALFGGFQRSTRRMTLFARLREYVAALRRAEIRGALIVDGSFVMSCIDEPDDIDVVLVLAKDWDLTADLQPFQYVLVSKRDVKRNYPIEVFPVLEGSDAERKWTEYFQQINTKWYASHGFASGSRKGLVRIAL